MKSTDKKMLIFDINLALINKDIFGFVYQYGEVGCVYILDIRLAPRALKCGRTYENGNDR
jgi:hypothetical protein